MLGEEVAERRIDDPLDLAVAKLGLGLAFELREGHAHGDHGGKPLANVFAAGNEVLEDLFFLAVGVERAGQARAEAGEVRAALDGVDVVHEAVNVFGILGSVLERDLHGHLVEFALHARDVELAAEVDHLGVQRLAGAVEVADEFLDPLLVLEGVAGVGAKVAEDDLHAGVQEGQFLQPAMEHAVNELDVGENAPIGLEGGLGAGAVGGADAANVGRRHALFVLLLVDVPAAADLHLAPIGKEIDDRDPDAVQAAGSDIGPLGELATELQHRHYALERGEAQVGMDLDGDPAAIIFDGYRTLAVDLHGDLVSVARHRFVDRVVDHFIDEVVQAADRRVANVHGRALAHVLQVAQVLELLGAVLPLDLAIFDDVRVHGGGRVVPGGRESLGRNGDSAPGNRTILAVPCMGWRSQSPFLHKQGGYSRGMLPRKAETGDLPCNLA